MIVLFVDVHFWPSIEFDDTQHQLWGSKLCRCLEPWHVVHVGRFEFGEMRGERAGGGWFPRVVLWFSCIT